MHKTVSADLGDCLKVSGVTLQVRPSSSKKPPSRVVSTARAPRQTQPVVTQPTPKRYVPPRLSPPTAATGVALPLALVTSLPLHPECDPEALDSRAKTIRAYETELTLVPHANLVYWGARLIHEANCLAHNLEESDCQNEKRANQIEELRTTNNAQQRVIDALLVALNELKAQARQRDENSIFKE